MTSRFFRLLGVLTALMTIASAAPTITAQPSPATQTVNVGATVTYTVTATGAGVLSYQWAKRTTAPYAAIVGATGPSLTLTNVQPADAATYRVTVTDGTGSASSSAVSLSVTSVAPVVTPTTALQHSAITLGSAATFTVTATGSGLLSYQWKKNGVDLAGQTAANLAFAAVQTSDEADYTVTVSNAFGSVTSEPARLWVVPPTSQFVSASFTSSTGFRLPYYYIPPPNYDSARRYPLWIFFHGASDTESSFLTGTGAQGFSRVCVSYARQSADPIIAVYVTRQAGSTNWNGYAPVVAELIPRLQTNFSVDPDRIYVVGESAGGKAAVDLVTLSPTTYAAFVICDGTGDNATVSAISGVPLWAVWSQGDTVVTGTPSWVQAFRRAGGKAVFTQFVTPAHSNSIFMGLSLPPLVDWLFARKRGVPTTNEPQVSITTPTHDAIHKTSDTAVSLAGTASAFGRIVTAVAWENATTGATGNASGTESWSTSAIPLASGRSSLLLATATIGTSWAPAYGGGTTFNDTLLVTAPFDAAIVPQGTSSALLSWTGGYAPFRVQSSVDLISWTDLRTNVTSPVSVSLSGPRLFFRVVGQ